MNKKNRLLLTTMVVATSIGLSGCHVFTRNPYTDNLQVSNTVKGAAILATAAGGTALAVGANPTTAWSVAGGGAVVGAIGGYYMDKKEARLLQQMRCAGVRVIDNVNDASNCITLVMPSDVQFRTGSAAICPRFQQVLDAVAVEMKEYKYSVAEIVGNADSVGSYSYNCNLAARRAQAVTDYLAAQCIPRYRLVPRSFGENCPVANNGSNCGRAMNRNVYIVLHQPPILSNKPVLNQSPVGRACDQKYYNWH